MGSLAIALESGFDLDHVVVQVDDRVVLDEEQVSTRYQIGLARMLEVPVETDEVRVDVRLPNRGIAAGTDVHVVSTPSLRISVEHGEVVFNASDAPLFYA